MNGRAALIVAVGLALAYWVAGGVDSTLLPPLPLALLKASGILVLAAYALRLRVPDNHLFAAGLIASAIGDILINLAPLPAGLGAFLVAHVLYATVFIRAIRRGGAQHDRLRYAAIALIAILLVGMPVFIWANLGAMRLPVLVYSAAVSAMAVCAALAPARGVWLAAGGVLFALSDSLIGLDVFASSARPPEFLFWPGIWLCYFAAQFCLTLGFSNMPQARSGA